MSDFLEYSTTGKPHPFHIVRPSLWPLVGALSAGLLATGALLYMHHIKLGDFSFGLKGVVLGLAGVLLTINGFLLLVEIPGLA